MSLWDRLFRPNRLPLPELFEGSEEGFVDGTLRIVNQSRTADGARSFHVRALSGRATLGFVVEVIPGWRPDTLGKGIPVFWGSVRYRSLGPESNAFLRALARAYGQPGEHLTMAPTILFASVALSGNPDTFVGGSADMKLFFESEDESRYAEVYTNLHPGRSIAEFREKDPGYRAALVRALSGVAA